MWEGEKARLPEILVRRVQRLSDGMTIASFYREIYRNYRGYSTADLRRALQVNATLDQLEANWHDMHCTTKQGQTERGEGGALSSLSPVIAFLREKQPTWWISEVSCLYSWDASAVFTVNGNILQRMQKCTELSLRNDHSLQQASTHRRTRAVAENVQPLDFIF